MRSIERYLLGWVLGMLGLGALVMALVAYRVTLDEMNEVYDADLKHVAEALGSYHHAGQNIETDSGRPLPERQDLPDPEEIITILWSPDGQRVYSSDPRVAIPFMGHEALTRTRVGSEEWIVYTDVSRNGVAQAAQRVLSRHEAAAEAASKILPAMIFLSLVVSALLMFALRRGLLPLDEAARDIAMRTARTLAPMSTTDVPRELSPLVQAINTLMARLSEALATQRRFLGDAAHELRSPVTALRLQLQLLKRSSDERSAHEAMKELEGGIDRSQRLIEKLLQVARSEPDAESRPHESVDLRSLALGVVGGLSLKAEQRSIDLGAQVMRDVVIRGDPHDLEVLMTNLIENALRYTPAGGVVDVEVCLLGGRPTLRVVDNGPGIGVAERERVFDRFHRGSAAQVSARESGGSGLGLAIVRAIAERHGAAASLHTAPAGKGLEVQILFADQARTASVAP